ncbi:MAG: hypothetical protein LUI12_11525 [Clostridiales bacterium]|nr:hypothetical protein [Clostridiales bacterium]
MPNYELNINITETDLQTIYAADEKIIIVKHTEGSAGKDVAWISFRPFMHNTIQWTTEFAIYASNTEVQGGATINKLSDRKASTKIIYDFNEGYFAGAEPCSELAANTYAVKNSMKGYPALTFGLAQDVSVNGRAFANNPINAISIPFGQSASMTPIEKVDVYLRNDINDGTVISHIMSVALPVEYSESEVSHSIAYDGTVGKFYPLS